MLCKCYKTAENNHEKREKSRTLKMLIEADEFMWDFKTHKDRMIRYPYKYQAHLVKKILKYMKEYLNL